MSNRSKIELIWEVMSLLRAMGMTTDRFDQAAAERLGVNRTDFRVLDMLERNGPLPPSRLAELNDLSRPAMTTVIDRLEKARYARRVPDPSDRRRVLVEITPLARRRAMDIYRPIGEVSQQAFGDYTAEELEVIASFLARSIELTEEQLEGLRRRS
jgi:DNA-binding MarR family transcriptional regulator